MRNTTVSARESTYVEAARALGRQAVHDHAQVPLRQRRSSRCPVIGTLNAADALGTLAALGFLGFGIQPTEASEWGYDLSRALDDAQAGIWWPALFPGLALILLITALTLVGEGLNETLNPALRRRRFQPVVFARREKQTEEVAPMTPIELAESEQAPVDRGPVLEARDLRVWYGTDRGPVKAVDGVSFELRRGEILGLVGESGCGKSTLGPWAARPAARRRRPRRASCASRAGTCSPLKRQAAARHARPRPRHDLPGATDPAEPADADLRALRGDPAGPRASRSPRTRCERRSLEALRVMGIPPTRFNAYPHEFSGGMRQRLMIALTLVLRPAFVVADEPTTALDVLVEAQIIRILHDLRRDFDTALLLITHNLGIVAEACDRVAVMYAGEIVEIGDAREVFSRPKHPYTRELLRSTISLRTTGLNYIDGAPPDLVEPPTGLPLPPALPGRDERVRHAASRSSRDHGGGTRAACWAADLADGLVTLDDHEKAALPREEISVADEA